MKMKILVYLVLALAGVSSAGQAFAAGGFVSRTGGGDSSSSSTNGQG